MLRRTAALIVLWLAAAAQAHALPIGETSGAENGVNVRGQATIPNGPAEANDLHFTVRANEDLNEINGIRPNSADPFTDYQSTPTGGSSVDLMFSGGVVGANGMVTVDLDVWLKDKNSLFIENITWTKDGAPIGRVRAGNGWQISDPKDGGDRDDDDDVGGGGMGGQQGGGGDGHFIHEILIGNSEDKAIEIFDIKLLASMIRYDDIGTDVPWDQVLPLSLAGPVILQPGEEFLYDFETWGAYRGGHVYIRYEVDDPVIMIGDHPVPVPVPLPAGLLAGAVLATWCAARTRKQPS